MPIGYLNISILSAARGQTAVGLVYYICRLDGENPNDGRRFYYAADAGDLIGKPIVLLPPGADPALNDPVALMVAAEQREITKCRKSGKPRFKKRGQIAKHVVLSLPKELTDWERRKLAVEWAKARYPGVGIVIAIHRPDDPLTGNYHAHLLVTTRLVGPRGLGKKARHLDPRFAGKKGTRWHFIENENLPTEWSVFQNAFFRREGIQLAVDPFRARGGRHLGRARWLDQSDRAIDNAALKAEARARMLDPKLAVEHVTRNRTTFTRNGLRSLLRKHDIIAAEAEDVISRVLLDPDTLRLCDPMTGTPTDLFTTRVIRDREAQILEHASALSRCTMEAGRRKKIAADIPNRANAMGLAPEQEAAFKHALLGGNLTLIRGVAGAGKSYTVTAIRKAAEAAGFNVIGLGPTNTVVASQAADGFSTASTLHAERYRQQRPDWPTRFSGNDVIILDEAAMADSEMLLWLLEAAHRAGAKVILVGDEKQLASVAPGGMFGILKAKFGAAELRQIRRQEQAWAQQASLDLSEGRMAPALAAYDRHGKIAWGDNLEQAMATLIRKWRSDVKAEPDMARFVYVATNAVANELNGRLQAARYPKRTDFSTFDCDRGRVRLFQGDRLQFHATEKKLGILNGQVGNVVSSAPDEIVVQIDQGPELRFDPRAFTGWGLGYCGTTYRGQGKTLPVAYALYDHVRSWSARSSYVAMTRHRQHFDLFVPRNLAKDIDQLAKQMSRSDGADASHAYLTEAEAAVRFPRVVISAAREDGSSVSVDAADPASAEILKTHWQLVPAPRFKKEFKRLEEAAAEADRNSPVHDALFEARHASRIRGFLPWTGDPDPGCITDFFNDGDDLPLSGGPVPEPGKGSLDLRNIVLNIGELTIPILDKMSRRLEQLDHHVLDAGLAQLTRFLNGISTTLDLFSDICFSRHLIRSAKLAKPRDADGRPQTATNKDFEKVFLSDPTPRATLGRLFLEGASGDRATLDELQGNSAGRRLARVITRHQAAHLGLSANRQPMASAAPQSPPTRGHAAVLNGQECEDRADILSGVRSPASRQSEDGVRTTPPALPRQTSPAPTLKPTAPAPILHRPAAPSPKDKSVPQRPALGPQRRPRDDGPAL